MRGDLSPDSQGYPVHPWGPQDGTRHPSLTSQRHSLSIRQVVAPYPPIAGGVQSRNKAVTRGEYKLNGNHSYSSTFSVNVRVGLCGKALPAVPLFMLPSWINIQQLRRIF